MSRRHRQRNADRPMEPFVQGKPNDEPWFLERIRDVARERDMSESEIEEQVQTHLAAQVYTNDRYTAFVRGFMAEDGKQMVHLSIKRNDRGVIDDFRELQRIKTLVVGAEVEAVQVFPRESELVDSSNQYHLWCYMDPAYRRPFGFHERRVELPQFHGAKQRRFADETVKS